MKAGPKIKPAKLEKRRPTQTSVGFVEVAEKGGLLRRRVPVQVLSESPKAALARALDLSHRTEAEHLPG